MMDDSYQDKVLACMQRVPEFMSASAGDIRQEYFTGVPRRNLCKMMVDFWSAYRTCLTNDAFSFQLRKLVDEGKIKEIEVEPHVRAWASLRSREITDWAFVLDELVKFIKQARIKLLIQKSMETYLPKEDFGAIEQEMARIAGINAGRRVQPYDYYSTEAIRQRQTAREDEAKGGKLGISTGIPPLDDRLHAGGFYHRELYVFSAPPKRGKTMALLWFSNQAALQGRNVAHFSCEVSREVCAKRLDAANTGILIRDVTDQSDYVAGRMLSDIPRGKLILYEYPTKTLTPQMLEGELDRLRNEEGIVVDMVVVDYLDIMRMQNPDRSSAWADQGPLAEELRRIAGQYDVPVVTATQINRGGAGKALISGRDIAGSFEKVMVADEVFTLSATDDELREGKLRINSSESRNSEGGVILISTAFGYGRFFSEHIRDEL